VGGQWGQLTANSTSCTETFQVNRAFELQDKILRCK